LTWSNVRHIATLSALLATAISASGQITIDTFAGGYIPSGVPAQNVALGSLSGVTRDPNGNLVFCDYSNNVIRRINADGKIQTIAGIGILGYGGDGGPALSATLNNPGHAKYDGAGNLYFVDVGNNRIRRIDTSGIITTVAGTGISGSLGADGPATQAQIGSVTDLAVDTAGNVYFAEYGQAAIRRLTPPGHIEVYATCSACATSYSTELALALDKSGNLYVADQVHVFRISTDGAFHNFAGFGPYSTPNMGNGGLALNAPPSGFVQLATDSAGNVYTEEGNTFAGEQGTFIIRRIGTDGIINIVAGTFNLLDTGTTAGGPALQTPLGGGLGLFPDANGVVTFVGYLSLCQLTTQATIQTVAGGQPLDAPDGTAARSAWFVQPNSIAFNHAGELYVGQPCIIQKISSNGLLSTIAGTGQCTASSSSSGPALTTQLTQVNSLVVDSHDQVYFADFYGTLYVVSAAGVISEVAEITPAIPNPKLAIDPQDRVYFLGDRIFGRVVSGQAPEYIDVPGSNPDEESSSVMGAGLAVDDSGNIYACCDETILSSLPIIFRYSPNLSFGLLNLAWTGPINDYGIAVDSSSNVWQGQSFLGLEKGTLSFGAACCSGTSYGDGGAAESAYISPSALAFAPNGDLYVLDSGAGRVRRIHGSPPTAPPAIAAGGIVNAASLAGGAIAPGELITIFGSDFGPPGLDVAAVQNNVIPKSLNNVHVHFGLGDEGAITARTQTQINVFVPYDVANATSTQVIVDVDGVTSAAVTVPVAPSAFGLSTAGSSGSGQGAILNQDGAYNSHSNPAARGSIVTMFGTGEGVTTPALPDGALEISTPYSATQAPVVVKFGGQTASIQYAGAAPFLPTGVFQINATVPESVTPGDVPITVSIGGIGTTRTVTVAVQ
jgi:uncharacterized protein (TIGR03437 family)